MIFVFQFSFYLALKFAFFCLCTVQLVPVALVDTTGAACCVLFVASVQLVYGAAPVFESVFVFPD